MKLNLSVFPIDNSLGYIIHQSYRRMAVGLQRAFQAKGYDITPEQWSVLSRLWEIEGFHQRMLAKKTAKDRHNITRILNLLEKNGFVKRTRDSQDRRILRVYLTVKGKSLQKKLTPIVIDFLQTCFTGLTQKDIQELKRIHKKIRQNLKAQPS